MNSFIQELKKDDAKTIEIMRRTISEADRNFSESVGKIMSIDRCLIYQEDEVFKYGLIKTMNYF